MLLQELNRAVPYEQQGCEEKKIFQSVCKHSQTKLVHPPCLSLHVANASDEVKTYLRLTYSQYGLVNYCYQAFNCHFVQKKHSTQP